MKRTISIVLCMAIIFSIMPAFALTAFAEGAHTITVTPTEGAEFYVFNNDNKTSPTDLSTVKSGDTIVVITVADDGKVVSELDYGSDATATNLGTGFFEFKMPDRDVTIVPTVENGVSANYYAKERIKFWTGAKFDSKLSTYSNIVAGMIGNEIASFGSKSIAAYAYEWRALLKYAPLADNISEEYSMCLSGIKPYTFALFLDYFSNPDNHDDIDVVKGILNSDVLFKAKEKMIEAVQTKATVTILTTAISLYPPVIDEIKKVYEIDEGESLPNGFFDRFVDYYTGPTEFDKYKASVDAKYEDAVSSGNAVRAQLENALAANAELRASFDKALADKLAENVELIAKLMKDLDFDAKAVLTDGGVEIAYEKLSDGITGTEIYAANGEGKFELKKTATDTSLALAGVAAEYKIVQYIELNGKKIYSKEKIVKPEMEETKIALAKSAKKAITVKWAAVPGALEYKVYYKKAGAKSAKYVVVNGKTTAKLSKLVSGKKYTIKVKPIYSVGNVDLAGAWSAAKTIAVK